MSKMYKTYSYVVFYHEETFLATFSIQVQSSHYRLMLLLYSPTTIQILTDETALAENELVSRICLFTLNSFMD